MLPTQFPKPSFSFNQHSLEQYPPLKFKYKEQSQVSILKPDNNLKNSNLNVLTVQSVPPIMNSFNQSDISFNNVFVDYKNSQHFTNIYNQRQLIPNYKLNCIEDLLKFPPPKINNIQPTQGPAIDLWNVPSQNQKKIFPNQPSSINDFLKFPPPNISNLQPVIRDLINLPPPGTILNSPTSIHSQVNVFDSQKIYQNNGHVQPFMSSTDNSSQNNSSFSCFISEVDSLDKLFVNNLTKKIRKRLNLESNMNICLKNVSNKIEELRKLEESLIAINHCPYFIGTDILKNDLESKIYSNDGEETKIKIDKEVLINCQCYDILRENTLNIIAIDHSQIIQGINSKIKELKIDLNDDGIQNAALKYKKMQKKKERLKRNKQMTIVEKENSLNRLKLIEKKFDEWQKNIAREEKIIKEKLELQKAVEITMSEVRLKIADLNKQMKLLNQIKKLRKLRTERRKKNDLSTEEFNLATKNFELRTGALEKFMNNQMSIYKDEEHTLKVMLDIEAEMDAEMQLRRQKKDVQMRTSFYKKQINEYLFGQKLDVKCDDPMFSFYKHYKMADSNIDSFLAIRSEWDSCIVSKNEENSSFVNLTYFLPSPPSNPQWAEYLIK